MANVPLHEKVKNGTLQRNTKQSINADLPEIPPPPSYLNAAQKKLYYKLCEHVYDSKAMHVVDVHYLGLVAVSFYLCASATITCNADEGVEYNTTGGTTLTAAYRVLKSERDFINTASKKLGLTVKDRELINSLSIGVLENMPNTKSKDPFARKLKKVG